MLATARHLYNNNASPSDSHTFRPEFSYLRATFEGRTVFLVLGYVDPHPEGPTEVWYSGSGETVRLRNGRLVATAGLTTDWRAVRLANTPAWAKATTTTTTRFQRERDLMPGYRSGIRDDIEQRPIEPPTDSLLAGRPASSLRWIEERSSTRPASASLPPARFGLAQVGDKLEAVYSEQCLSRDLCLSFERWNPSAPANVASTSAAGS
ncbi:YjbF family lipoprotein [Variovorax paradoxus]|jgi:hypothetical protein|uniref:YjbF family lipoprotein n=1 Tax=Variovorax paradoxus TaxID=34073 RepID=UPI00040ED5A8